MILRLLLFAILFASFLIIVNLGSVYHIDARCPNGYHKSPSGDCEKVTDNKGKPRCPNGYHQSPGGICEQVTLSGNNGDGGNSGDAYKDIPSGNSASNSNPSSPYATPGNKNNNSMAQEFNANYSK